MYSDIELNSFWTPRILFGTISLLAYIFLAVFLFFLLRSRKRTLSEDTKSYIITNTVIGAFYYGGLITLIAIFVYLFDFRLPSLEFLSWPFLLIAGWPTILHGLFTGPSQFVFSHLLYWAPFIWIPSLIYGGLITNIFMTKRTERRKRLIKFLIISCVLGLLINFISIAASLG